VVGGGDGWVVVVVGGIVDIVVGGAVVADARTNAVWSGGAASHRARAMTLAIVANTMTGASKRRCRMGGLLVLRRALLASPSWGWWWRYRVSTGRDAVSSTVCIGMHYSDRGVNGRP
jgi:hypothetical protein